jgi:pilus assembly protein CpaB
MKWVTNGLFALGTVAAICAAVLVASMQSGSDAETNAPPRDVTVAVAARDLPAMLVLDESAIVTRTVRAGLAPAGSFGDPVQIIGKVLTSPVQAGQAFTEDAFAADGSPMRLAAALPEGRRAVTITMRDALGGENLLYPGCFVDVLATLRMNNSEGDMPVTITLLQGVSVLAVGNRTIVSPGATDAAAPIEEASTSDRPAITLLVDSRQAEMLKLAMEEGRVSVVLRNPHDIERPSGGGTDVAALAPGFGMVPQPPPSDDDDGEVQTVYVPAPMPVPGPLQRTWEAVVLRGGQRESSKFDLPTSSQP